MAIQYHFNRDLKVLLVKGVGTVSLDDLLRYGKEVLNMDEDFTGAVEYVDLSEATDIAVSYHSAQQMLNIYKGWAARGIKASILYTPSDFSYGIARMIGAVLSSVAGNSPGGPLITRTPIQPENLSSWLAGRNETGT